MVPFSRLVLGHRNIGLHRDRRWGFRDVFGFRSPHGLHGLPFLKLADRVKRAYEGIDVPSHEGWPAQRSALEWLVSRGRDGIYALDERGITVTTAVANVHERYFVSDGNHRALALYILGESEVRARIKSPRLAFLGR